MSVVREREELSVTTITCRFIYLAIMRTDHLSKSQDLQTELNVCSGYVLALSSKDDVSVLDHSRQSLDVYL